METDTLSLPPPQARAGTMPSSFRKDFTIMANLPVCFQTQSSCCLVMESTRTLPFWQTGALMCQPNIWFLGSSFVAFPLVQGAKSRLDFFKWCLPLGCSSPCFPQISEGFLLLFLFTFLRSTLFGAWFGLLAAPLGKKCGGASAGCPHKAVSWKFPSLEISLCFSKAWSQPSNLDFLQSVDPWP